MDVSSNPDMNGSSPPKTEETGLDVAKGPLKPTESPPPLDSTSSGSLKPPPASETNANLVATQDTKVPLMTTTESSALETPEVETTETDGSRHNTRSKGSREGKKIVSMQRIDSASSISRQSDAASAKSSRDSAARPLSTRSIDECARLLASVDEHAYERAILQDADRMLESYVFPMCFPWNHQVPSIIKNMPRDIDELHAITHVEDELYTPFGDDGTFGFGGFEVGKDRKSATAAADPQCQELRAASRRSDDPGVMELTILSKDPAPLPFRKIRSHPSTPVKKMRNLWERKVEVPNIESVLTPPNKRKRPTVDINATENSCTLQSPSSYEEDPDNDDISIPGELSYRWFRAEQEWKKRKTALAHEKTRKIHLSVRVGSVSSRSSILNGNGLVKTKSEGVTATSDSRPILCRAFLPDQVQTGMTLKAKDALRVATKLGSYDCRFDPRVGVASEKKKTSEPKTLAGRTRLLWSTVHAVESADRIRLRYSSLLNGKPLETITCKRPREVTVAIRINGVLVSDGGDSSLRCLPKAMIEEDSDSGCVLFVGEDGSRPSIASIEAAVDVACGTPYFEPISYDHGNSTCLLDTNELLRAVAHDPARTDSRQVSVVVGHGGSSEKFSFVLPQIDCLALNEGLLQTVCTAPGQLKPTCVQNLFNVASEPEKDEDGYKCSVCWHGSEESAVEKCSQCCLNAHLVCCLDRGERFRMGRSLMPWKCACCSAGAFETVVGNTLKAEGSGPVSPGARRVRSSKLPVRYQSGSIQLALPSADSPSSRGDRRRQVGMKSSPQSCCLCPHSGGAMSRGPEGKWTHEVCRIWAGSAAHSRGRHEHVVCSLCGERSTGEPCDGFVKCAANGCHVHFHPMCALVVTKILEQDHYAQKKAINGSSRLRQSPLKQKSQAKDDPLERLKRDDAYLSSLYTFEMIECNQIAGDTNASTVLPVAFCGIHNPNRESTLYGCYPGGLHMEKAIRVPSGKF